MTIEIQGGGCEVPGAIGALVAIYTNSPLKPRRCSGAQHYSTNDNRLEQRINFSKGALIFLTSPRNGTANHRWFFPRLVER